MGSTLFRALLLAGMFLPLCAPLAAQEQYQPAYVVLEVTDQSGAAVPNAQVQILPLPNTLGKNLTTGSDGKLILELPPGTFDLSVKQPGFATATKHIEVQPGTYQTIAILLKVPYGGPSVVVTSDLRVLFPEKTQAPSPDGRYVIVGVNSESSPHHRVFLEDRVRKTRRKLFNYDRNIVLLWHYNSKWFAVTDNFASDGSRCTIFSVDKKIRPMPVLDLLFRALYPSSRDDLKTFLSNHHAYVEAVAWDGPMILKVKVSGYGDANPGGFTKFYEAQLSLGLPDSKK